MKRSELKKIIKEIADEEIGKTEMDPETGIKSTLANIDPETGRHEWDIDYSVDPIFLYNKLDQLVDYMKKVPEGSELAKMRDIIKNLKNKSHRLITKNK